MRLVDGSAYSVQNLEGSLRRETGCGSFGTPLLLVERALDGVGPMRCQDSLGSDVLTVIVIEQEDVDEAAQRE